MKKYFKITSVSGILSLLLFIYGCQEKKPTTLYLVRHAEKDLSDTTENPPLTKEGLERAQQLKEMLEDEEIDRIYSTKYDRNIHTAKPLADVKGLGIKLYEWHNWQPMINEIQRSAGGETVVISGHGDNLLPMVEYVGGQPPLDSLGKYEYDKIFKVKVLKDTATASVIEY